MVIRTSHARTSKVYAVAFLTALLIAIFASSGIAQAATYANFSRTTYRYTSSLSVAQEASRYQVMLLQSTDAAIVPKLKAANPRLKLFMYEGIMAADKSNPSYTTCTSAPWVASNHPNWILRDQYGRLIYYKNHYLLDVGNSAYQQTCLTNVVGLARRDHFDGVYWDMANAKLSWTLPPGTSVPKYPSDASWQSAMYSMLSYANSQLHAHGLQNISNIGGAALFPGLWQKWNGALDGAEEEGFTDNKQGQAAAIWAWPAQLAAAAWSEAHHKLTILHSWNTTHAGNVWGLASMMLVAGGESSYSTSNGCYYSCETWYPEYTTAQRLGAPSGAYTKLSNGVYERRFQNGLVLVNPTGSSVSRFSLGGGTYTGSGVSHVSAVSMAPASGYILLTDAPINTTRPTISGHVAPGRVLTATPGSWSTTPGSTYSYSWKRCTTTSLGSCAAIPGANGISYTVGAADAGHYLVVVVTVTNGAGRSSATSLQTPRVGATPPTTKHGHPPTIKLRRAFLIVHQLSRSNPSLAVMCPRRLTSRCTFRVTVLAAFSAIPGSAVGWKGKRLGNASLVLGHGQVGTAQLAWTSAGRTALALLGRALPVSIRVRVRYGPKVATFTVRTKISAPG